MFSSKEKSNFPSRYMQTPYSRIIVKKSDATVEKILNKPRTPENNYGRNFSSVKSFDLRNSPANHYKNVNEVPYGDLGLLGDDNYVPSVRSDYAESITSRSENVWGQFRPRRSQLDTTRPAERNLDKSLKHIELEMMNIGENSKNLENSKQKFIDPKGFQIKPRENLFRLFTGSVENLLQWFRLKNNFQILFEVTATVNAIQMGKWKCEKILFLNDYNTGPTLQVLYYEIDRPLPKLSIKSTVTCIGNLISRNRLHAFKIEESSEEMKNNSKRLAFMCNRVAEEMVASIQQKK